MTHAFSLPSDLVLTPRPSARVTCTLTRALLRRCDGHATLAEVARQLPFPAALSRALARRAVTRQWAAATTRPDWQERLAAVPGLNVAALLQEASTLIQASATQTEEEQQRDLHLAVQLLLRRKQRQMDAVLDDLEASDCAA